MFNETILIPEEREVFRKCGRFGETQKSDHKTVSSPKKGRFGGNWKQKRNVEHANPLGAVWLCKTLSAFIEILNAEAVRKPSKINARWPNLAIPEDASALPSGLLSQPPL